MGYVPLAAMLWSKNASFGGVMSFLGADLVAATRRKSPSRLRREFDAETGLALIDPEA